MPGEVDITVFGHRELIFWICLGINTLQDGEEGQFSTELVYNFMWGWGWAMHTGLFCGHSMVKVLGVPVPCHPQVGAARLGEKQLLTSKKKSKCFEFDR